MKRLKSFRRWMSETCLPCPPTHLDNNESYVFSFYEDIVQVNNRHFVSVAAVLCLLCFCVIWIDSGWVGGGGRKRKNVPVSAEAEEMSALKLLNEFFASPRVLHCLKCERLNQKFVIVEKYFKF